MILAACWICAEPAVRWLDGITPVCAQHDDDEGHDALDGAPERAQSDEQGSSGLS